MRALVFAALLASLCTAGWAAQQAPSAPAEPDTVAFAVATIKPSRPDEQTTLQIQGVRFVTAGTSLVDILKYAYGVHADQIVDAPKWLATEHFDIMADPGTATRPMSDDFKKMVQQLLADRFHLLLRRDTMQLPVYALTVAKGGPRLAPPTNAPANAVPSGGAMPGRLGVGNASMTDVASFLQRYVMDRPVVNQTGLPGRYTFELRWTDLRWTPDPTLASAAGTAAQAPDAPPGLYTAIQEQLGLKLVATRALVPVLVVDHVEPPSEN